MVPNGVLYIGLVIGPRAVSTTLRQQYWPKTDRGPITRLMCKTPFNNIFKFTFLKLVYAWRNNGTVRVFAISLFSVHTFAVFIYR